MLQACTNTYQSFKWFVIDDDAKKEKKKKEKEKKKKEKEKPEEGEGYLEDAIFGKKDGDLLDDDADEEESVDSEAGVDDSGAMSTFFLGYSFRSFPLAISRNRC